jgi:large subunit ribosomal protein L2
MSSLVFKNPTTPSQRHVSFLKRTTLMKTKILKNQSCFLKNRAGRNNQGRITSFHKGGGHKKKYRIVSYNRPTLSGIVESIEYDPYRSANIARVFSEIDNTHSYILAPEGLVRGNYINSQLNKTELTFKIGNLFYLKDLPLGVFVHNISFSGGRTGVARSAGCGAQIVSKDDKYCRLRLNSGEHRLFPLTAHATLGILSNPSHNLVNLGKAGRSRWLNKRPTVRGVAMNPIDHPHGGGEGRSSGGRPSVTPWGKITKGQPTVKKKINKLIIKKRK